MAFIKKSKNIYIMGNEEIDLSLVKDQMGDAKSRLINCYLLRNCTKENFPMRTFIKSFEEDLIKKALELARGNQRVAAMILGIKATTLSEKIKRSHISDPKDFRSRIELSSLINREDIPGLEGRHK